MGSGRNNRQGINGVGKKTQMWEESTEVGRNVFLTVGKIMEWKEISGLGRN